MRIVVTGGDGFIGQNLRVRLAERGFADVCSVTRATSREALEAAVGRADFVFHLAGVNRPTDPADFTIVNEGFTATICELVARTGRGVPIVLASSTQATLDNPYGHSKGGAERIVSDYGEKTGAPVFILRLTNVFGKWSRPNYNSAVATFCHNLARGISIVVHDASAPLTLLYVDDAVSEMIRLLDAGAYASGLRDVGPKYLTTVGEVADILRSFVAVRHSLVMPAVGAGLTRALYATYLSFLPPETFAYDLKLNLDARGVFVEMLKTTDAGQFSYFTAGPGITRGDHYHHTKNEKFLVVQGRARFAFRHLLTAEMHEIVTDSARPRVVETVPGWVHNITNIGTSEMIVLLWANEIFDRDNPDTVPAKVLA